MPPKRRAVNGGSSDDANINNNSNSTAGTSSFDSSINPPPSAIRVKRAPAVFPVVEYVRGPTIGEVFSFGSGDMSQLGLGDAPNMRARKKPTLIKEFSEKSPPVSIVSLSVGSLHNAVITEEGSIWTWGCNDDHALGREGDEFLPAPVVGPLGHGVIDALTPSIKVAQIRCGSSHTLALTTDGRVFGWGTYRDSQSIKMGFDLTTDTAKSPQQFHFFDDKGIVMIAGGDNHCLALSASGQVYQWGDIGVGQRSSARHTATKLTPRTVTFPASFKHRLSGQTYKRPKIVKIFAGGNGSFAINEEGVVWAWGPNNYYQCGIRSEREERRAIAEQAQEDKQQKDEKRTETEIFIQTPTPIPYLNAIQKVASAVHHALFLTTSGDVYAVGKNADGRLGVGDTREREVPTLIKVAANSIKFVDISCGESHSLFISTDHKLYSCGNGDLLQLGNGEMEDLNIPTRVESQQLDEFERDVGIVRGGSQHTVLLAWKRQAQASASHAEEKKE